MQGSIAFGPNFTQNSVARKNHEEDLARYIERIEKEDFIEFEKMLEDPAEDEEAQNILEQKEEVHRIEIPDSEVLTFFSLFFDNNIFSPPFSL